MKVVVIEEINSEDNKEIKFHKILMFQGNEIKHKDKIANDKIVQIIYDNL
jgi:ribosomal protein L21